MWSGFGRPAYPHTHRGLRWMVEPTDHFISWQQDAFGNFLARLVFRIPLSSHQRRASSRTSRSSARSTSFVEEFAETVPFRYPTIYVRTSRFTCARLTTPDPVPDRPNCSPHVGARSPGDARHADHRLPVEINRAVSADVSCSVRMEPGVRLPTHPAIGRRLLPRLGLASGVDPSRVRPRRPLRVRLPGPTRLRCRRPGRAVRPRTPTFTDLHAWTGGAPGRGWIGMDPTSGPVRRGGAHRWPPPASGLAAPITGSTGITETIFGFSNTVTRVHGTPGSPYLHRCRLGRHHGAGTAGRRSGWAADVRVDDGRGADLRLDNQVDRNGRRTPTVRTNAAAPPR